MERAEVNAAAEAAPGKEDARPEERHTEDLARRLFRIHLDQVEQQGASPTPEFPESLYELLCALQEGRRLNDQRCSFVLDQADAAAAAGVRRRCHSEPNSGMPKRRAVFSSLTSLQREEFFELVAKAQARRLDGQRALLLESPAGATAPATANKRKGPGFRGSLKHLSLMRRPPKMPAKEDLYHMILATQAQGRLEDQRSRAPGPMDDEDFFSLLLRVQGGRMDEQRTSLLQA
ncbi:G-protein-signaling modulator 1-like [Stigmatopora nigra]